MGVRRKTVIAATRAELVKANKLDSAMGAAALALAARLDDPETPGGAMAPTAKELRTTLESLTRGADAVGDPIDEVKRQREKRLKAAGSQ